MSEGPVTRAEFDALVDKVCDIHTAIIGDAQFKRTGLIDDVNALKVWRYGLMKTIVFASGAATGIGFLLKFIITGKF